MIAAPFPPNEDALTLAVNAYDEATKRFDALSTDTEPQPADEVMADPVEQNTLVAAKAEHDEYHVVYFEDCVWCRSWALDKIRKTITESEKEMKDSNKILKEAEITGGNEELFIAEYDRFFEWLTEGDPHTYEQRDVESAFKAGWRAGRGEEGW